MTIPTLVTESLVLRPWSLDDAPLLFSVLIEPGILDYFPPVKYSLEKTRRYVEHQLSHWNKYGYGHWAVTLKSNNQVVGWNGLEFLPESNETEVAYLLSHQVWGRGYATQAANAALDFGFNIIGLDIIIGLVHPENLASIRVLEKCGLAYEDNREYWDMEMRRYRKKSKHYVTSS